MNIEHYESEKIEKKLLMKLQEAEEAVKNEGSWMSLKELKKSVGVQLMMNLRIKPIMTEGSIQKRLLIEREYTAIFVYGS